MTRNSDPQAEPAGAEGTVREPTEEEAERAAAQFRAAWQTQHLVPSAPAAAADTSSPPVPPKAEAPAGEIAAHPILPIAPPGGARAPAEPAGAALLNRTMVGVPPPPTDSRPPVAPDAAPRPEPAHFNRTVVGLPLPGPPASPELGSAAPASSAPAAPGAAASVWPPAAPSGVPRAAGSFPPAAQPAFIPEAQPERISVRPNVISAWDLPEPQARTRRAPSPALIVLVVASVALLFLVATRFLGSDSEETTEGQPSRTEAVLAEDEAAPNTLAPNTSVRAARPGSSSD